MTVSSARRRSRLIRHFLNRAGTLLADGVTRRFERSAARLLKSTANMLFRPPFVAALAAIVLATAGVRADDVQRREDQFKAAYLFNFVKFVEWPSGVAGDSLTVCFLGGEGVHEALASSIASKGVGARKLIARQLEPPATVENCEVLYADAASVDHSLAAGLPVLTVSDAPGFATHGGMIELFTENHRLRFVINVAHVNRAGLRISSDLLKLAASVQREEQ
jgi:hypothetical protein